MYEMFIFSPDSWRVVVAYMHACVVVVARATLLTEVCQTLMMEAWVFEKETEKTPDQAGSCFFVLISGWSCESLVYIRPHKDATPPNTGRKEKDTKDRKDDEGTQET